MNRTRKISALLASMFVVAALSACGTTTKLETRQGVTVRVDTFIPENSVASVLILRGAFGNIVDYKYYPLSSVSAFNQADIAVAVMGVPSNRRGLTLPYRLSDAHKTDLKKTIAKLRRESGKPVWVLGSSTGSVSATVAGILGGPDLAGVILMSSVTAIENADKTDRRARALLRGPGIARNVQDLELEKIKVPTLVIRHEKDECAATPPEGGSKIMARLKNSPKTRMLTFSGGYARSGNVCDTAAYHLFAGIDYEVTLAMIKFIKANSK